MENAIEKLFDTITEDYSQYCDRQGRSNTDIQAFRDSLSCTIGKKYIRIKRGDSAWGFVVNTDMDKKFYRGDILMAAGYKTPARNAARGNLFTGYNVKWTGPNYLV